VRLDFHDLFLSGCGLIILSQPTNTCIPMVYTPRDTGRAACHRPRLKHANQKQPATRRSVKAYAAGKIPFAPGRPTAVLSRWQNLHGAPTATIIPTAARGEARTPALAAKFSWSSSANFRPGSPAPDFAGKPTPPGRVASLARLKIQTSPTKQGTVRSAGASRSSLARCLIVGTSLI
jgi:hypothetical protein